MRCYICDYERFAKSDFHNGLKTKHIQYAPVIIDPIVKQPICQECLRKSKQWSSDDGEIELIDIGFDNDLDRYS